MRTLGQLCVVAVLLALTGGARAESVDWSQYLEEKGSARPTSPTVSSSAKVSSPKVKSRTKRAARPAGKKAVTKVKAKPRAKPKARRK
jgi:hypothetical protein